jgi:hypothetical protein
MTEQRRITKLTEQRILICFGRGKLTLQMGVEQLDGDPAEESSAQLLLGLRIIKPDPAKNPTRFCPKQGSTTNVASVHNANTTPRIMGTATAPLI